MFVRSDLVDKYEKECRDIVNKYEGQQTEDILIEMFSELNQALYRLGIDTLWEKKPRKEE